MQDAFKCRSAEIPYVQVSVKAHPNTDEFKDDFHCALTINGININGSITDEHGAPKIVIEKSLSDISGIRVSIHVYFDDSVTVNL